MHADGHACTAITRQVLIRVAYENASLSITMKFLTIKIALLLMQRLRIIYHTN